MINQELPLIEKYRAKSFEDIKGQDLAVQEVRTFFKMFPRKKALILNGPVGEEVLRPSVEQRSLFKKGKIILMDEADGITGSDRGGLPELIALIAKTSFPIIVTANDIWQKKFSLLRKKCQIINLKELKDSVVFEIIKEVCNKEGKEIKVEVLNLITQKARGDVRAALNDLQSILNLGEEEFLLEISEREKQESIFDALKKVFQSETGRDILRVYDNIHLQLDEVLLWVEENISLEYQGKALARAYDALSKADLFKGRIYRQQHWRFLVYENFFLSAGISSATKLKNNKFVSYKRPSRILKIWLSNQKNAKRKSIVVKYASLCHMSKKKALKEKFLLPLILDGLDERTYKKMDLDEKEKEFLKERKGAMIVANGLNRFRG